MTAQEVRQRIGTFRGYTTVRGKAVKVGVVQVYPDILSCWHCGKDLEEPGARFCTDECKQAFSQGENNRAW